MNIITQEKVNKEIKGISNSIQNIVNIAYDQGYEYGKEANIDFYKEDILKDIQCAEMKSYNEGFNDGKKDTYAKATNAILKIYKMTVSEKQECFGFSSESNVGLDEILSTLGFEDVIFLLEHSHIGKTQEEKQEEIKVGDVCVYPKTINEPFIYLGKVDTWHFALGRNTMEKYSFKGLTGIKKTGEHVTDITSILIKDKEEE